MCEKESGDFQTKEEGTKVPRGQDLSVLEDLKGGQGDCRGEGWREKGKQTRVESQA